MLGVLQRRAKAYEDIATRTLFRIENPDSNENETGMTRVRREDAFLFLAQLSMA